MKRTKKFLAVFMVLFTVLTAMPLSDIANLKAKAAETWTTENFNENMYVADIWSNRTGDFAYVEDLITYFSDEAISPCGTFLESLWEDPNITICMVEWETAKLTADLGSAVDLNMKFEDYCELVILDAINMSLGKTIATGVYQNTALSYTKGITDAMSSLIGSYKELTELDIKKPKDKKKFDEMLEKTKFSRASDIYDYVGNIVGYSTDILSFIDKLAQYLVLDDIDINLLNCLKHMYKICPNGTDMKTALKKIIRNFESNGGFALNALRETAKTGSKWVYSEIVGIALKGLYATNPALAAITTGFSLGVLCSNALFATDDVYEQIFIMDKMYEFETLVKRCMKYMKSTYSAETNEENAANYRTSVELFFYTIADVNCNTTIKLYDNLFNKGIIDFIKNGFGKFDGAEDVKETLTAIKENRQRAYATINNFWLRYLEASQPELYASLEYGSLNESYSDLEKIEIRDFLFIEKEISVGESITIDALYTPSDTKETGFRLVSSDENILSVNETRITAVSPGTVTLTMVSLSNSAITDSVELTVVNKDAYCGLAGVVSIGSKITLGTYNGEPINWICVDIDENGPLMLSEKVLCVKEYDAAGVDSKYHKDSWGYIRKNYGSNCWQDSNIRQWLNSNESVVSWTHCPPSYSNEAGFLANFTNDELACIKTVKRLVNVNVQESRRSGYCDGGGSDTFQHTMLEKNFTAKNYYYKNIEDTMFLLNTVQVNRIYNNYKSALNASREYWLAVSGGNNYACFEHVMTFYPGVNLGSPRAYEKMGVRPAFYLNTEVFSDGEKTKHKNVIDVAATPKSCVRNSYTAGKFCKDCGTWLEGHELIPGDGSHNLITKTTPATITKNGKQTVSCSDCDYYTSRTVFSPNSLTLSTTKYIYDGKNKTPKLTVKDANGKVLTKNVDYKITVASKRSAIGRHTVKVTFIGNYSGSKNLYFYILPGAPATVKSSSQGTTSNKLTWSSVPGAAGYTLYYYSNSKKAYKKINTTTDTSYTVKGLLTGTKYTFKVVAYGTTAAGKVYDSETYTLLKSATKTKTPELTKVTASSTKGKAYVYHTDVKGETGYTVYYSNLNTTGFKKYANFGADTTMATITGLTSGKTYYFKIRTYIKTDSGYVYSPWSAVKGVKVK